MSDEAHANDDDRRVIPINEHQRKLHDVLVELATLGERVTSFARVLYGAARDGDTSQYAAIRAVSKRIRENLIGLEASLLALEPKETP